jgi:CHAD domain-containing protein
MAYRIDFDRSLEHEVRRIASHQLSAAIDLLKEQPEGPHEAVHDARKHIKRTRALYRLIRFDAKKFAKHEDDRLGKVGGELTHLRDAAAHLEAARYLHANVEAQAHVGAIGRVTAALKGECEEVAGNEAALKATIKTAIAGLRSAAKALADLDLSHKRKTAASCLATGWQKVDSKAIEALAGCVEPDNSEAFHALRKRSQDRWMHASLLRPLWPTAMSSIGNEAKALVDVLGHEHDLAALADKLEKSVSFRYSDEDKQAVLDAISQQRRKLEAAGREAGSQLFDDKAARYSEIVERLIRAQ